MTVSDRSQPVLEMRGIGKSFFGVWVLRDVDLACHAGEVHAIVGENGAGKSVLMKTLAGAYQPDTGEILIDGRAVRFGHTRAAQAEGVSIIFQEFNLLPERTVAQNIFLGREPRRHGIVDTAALDRETKRLLSELHVADSIAPSGVVRNLSVAQQQMVEIAKALSLDARILVMDEPTAALSPHEIRWLFERVRRLQERGLAIIYISHRLAEVFELAERVTVLKDGARVGCFPIGDVTAEQLVRMMVGRELSQYFPTHATEDEIGEAKVRVRAGGGGKLHDVDLDLRAGEIVGIAGLEGSGRTELARAIFGADRLQRGTLELRGKVVRIESPRRAIQNGVGLLTEDRKAEGLVLTQSVKENALLSLRTLPLRLRRRRAARSVSVPSLIESVDVRAASLDQEVRYLSGGNQQKVVLAKWLATKADVLLFDEPTRGIDVGAKAGIYEVMRELARNGAAIMMISSELPEVIGMSDRILVMRNGTVVGELPPGASEAEIMLLATGERDLTEAAHG